MTTLAEVQTAHNRLVAVMDRGLADLDAYKQRLWEIECEIGDGLPTAEQWERWTEAMNGMLGRFVFPGRFS